MSEAEAALELAAQRRRLDTLARLLPLAAIEPDGLAITTDGTYVRVIEADHVLQPWRGGLDHRDRGVREGDLERHEDAVVVAALRVRG